MTAALALWARRALAAAVSTVAVAAIVPAAPAHADSARNRDMGYNHQICRNCTVGDGDIVGWWQTILWLDGYANQCASTPSSYTGLDGQFGPKSEYSSQQWQRRYGLAADGVVGPRSWRAAQGRMRVTSTSGDEYQYMYSGLTGREGGIWRFARTGSNTYRDWTYVPSTRNNGYLLFEAYSTSHPVLSAPTC